MDARVARFSTKTPMGARSSNAAGPAKKSVVGANGAREKHSRSIGFSAARVSSSPGAVAHAASQSVEPDSATLPSMAVSSRAVRFAHASRADASWWPSAPEVSGMGARAVTARKATTAPPSSATTATVARSTRRPTSNAPYRRRAVGLRGSDGARGVVR